MKNLDNQYAMPPEKEYTMEEMMALSDPKLKFYVAKLLLNQQLSDEEISHLASHTMFELATIAVHLTSEKLMNLGNPIAILSTVAATYSEISKPQNLNEITNYQKNIMAIQEIHNEKKGQSR